VKIEDAQPEGVKISKKSICFINIEPGADKDELDQANYERNQMIQYFITNKTIKWSAQFKIACMLGPTIDEDNLMDDVTCGEAIMHLMTIFWKVLFAIIPPKEKLGGWAAFLIALSLIGGITVIVGEIATLLGCAIGLKPSVTGITLVAMGTSLPDTFASKTAAQNSQYADSAIGNVTGSNSVNVFLGVGLPWVIGAMHRYNKYGTDYYVPAGSITFSVTVFLACSMVCFLILGLRRCFIGGELGGGGLAQPLSAFICFIIWVVYVTLVSLQAYGFIDA
jgi:solute carrier family 8 (sodium/calcium exchanger)